MNHIYMPVNGLSDWRRFLASPEKQWKRGGSAFEMAVDWEVAQQTARRMPPAVARMFDEVPALIDAELLLGIPEHRVEIPGGGHASQTDLWLLLKNGNGLISVAVEGKAGEAFDEVVSKWLHKAKPGSGKPERLEYLCRLLELDRAHAETCRYQLLHRTVVPILEARRFGAKTAVMLVQSWPTRPGNRSAEKINSWADYHHFVKGFGVDVQQGRLSHLRDFDGISLYVGWLACDPATDAQVTAASL